MPKKIIEHPLLPLFHKFINELKKGKQLQRNGRKVKRDSIKNYQYLELLLKNFQAEKNFDIRLKVITNLRVKQFEDEKQYWKDFYKCFTSYLYDDLGHFDNYVGRTIKLLRCFFNYLISEKNLNVGLFYKKFYAPSEDIDIIILSPERINYLIEKEIKEKQLSQELRKIKDVFVFGCSVALRYSDLMALTKNNLEIINDRMYIKIQSKKTQTYTRVKLDDASIKIVNKYSGLYVNKILPSFDKVYMNRKIKIVMEFYGFTEKIDRRRQRRGISETVYKNAENKICYRFCDAVTTHTMRRSAITNLLSSGASEETVRQISGHTANSKEFYRYVSLSQSHMDAEIDLARAKIKAKKLELAC